MTFPVTAFIKYLITFSVLQNQQQRDDQPDSGRRRHRNCSIHFRCELFTKFANRFSANFFFRLEKVSNFLFSPLSAAHCVLLTLHKRRRDFPRSSVSHFLSNWNNNNWHIFQASFFFGSSSRDGGRKFLSKKDEHHLTVITVCNFHLLSAKPRIFLTAGFFLCVFAGENGRAIQQCNIINFPFFLCGGDHVFASSRWEILKNFPRSFLSRRSRSANHFQLIKFSSVSTLNHRILYPPAVFLTVCNDFPGWVFPFPFWGFLNFTTHFLPLLFSGLFLFSTNIRVTDPRFPFFFASSGKWLFL